LPTNNSFMHLWKRHPLLNHQNSKTKSLSLGIWRDPSTNFLRL